MHRKKEPPLPSLTAKNASAAPAPDFTPADVVRVRGRLALSQSVFAQALNVSAETIRGWEQGKRVPDGASQRLLELADKHPEWLLDAIDATEVGSAKIKR